MIVLRKKRFRYSIYTAIRDRKTKTIPFCMHTNALDRQYLCRISHTERLVCHRQQRHRQNTHTCFLFRSEHRICGTSCSLLFYPLTILYLEFELESKHIYLYPTIYVMQKIIAINNELKVQEQQQRQRLS